MVECEFKNGHKNKKKTRVEMRLDYVLKILLIMLDATINIIRGGG